MEEELKKIRLLVSHLQNELKTLKEADASLHSMSKTSAEDTGENLNENIDNLSRKVHLLELEISSNKEELTELIEKMKDNEEKAQAGFYQHGIKGGPPPGMTQEQLQDFKKQGLQITGLQSKAKELEARIGESDGAIRRGQEKAKEMEAQQDENVKDLYTYFDNVNNTLSEKIASQRVEMEKLSGDTPQPINYDPFNYGDAYDGDIVDFQARKRILEIHVLLSGLTMSMNRMRDVIRISPAIDLGYRVVRLDELLHGTGFKDAVDRGAVSQGEALHVTQGENFDLPESQFPRKEIFQESQEQDLSWTIINSIMQTMYRLETEVGELQRSTNAAEPMKYAKELEDLMNTVYLLKETKVDVNQVRKMLEEEKISQLSTTQRNSAVPKSPVFARVESSVEALSTRMDAARIEAMVEKAVDCITLVTSRVKAVEDAMKTQSGNNDKNHIGPFPKSSKLNGPNSRTKFKDAHRLPPKLRALLNRAYRFHVENVFVNVYQIPRPYGSGYTVPWPRSMQVYALENTKKIELPVQTDEHLIQGTDGRWYKGHVKMGPPQLKTPTRQMDIFDFGSNRSCLAYPLTDE